MEWLNALNEFHFLRPLWFVALLPALLACILLYRQQANSGSWSKVISPALLPYLMDKPASGRRRNLTALWLFGWLIAVVGLAGPTFERTPLPVHKQESALVVVFDLSPSMLAQDLTPNRLTRARLKLIDLLQARKEGTTALVAYGGDAFVVSPLTDDAATITATVPALDPNIIPSHGSNVEAAIERAVELVLNTGQLRGDILLITDEVSAQGRDTLNVILRSMGDFRLFILGIGTKEGAPIPLSDGGFAKNRNDGIVVPKLDSSMLQKLASRHNGAYTSLTSDDRDIEFLNRQFEVQPGDPSKQLERTFDTWDDLGYWAALLILPLLLFASRRGLVACLLVIPTLLPQQSQAFELTEFLTKDLWQTKDQQAAKALEADNPAAAEQLFENPQWKAAAAYKNNNFETAQDLFNGTDADSLYNRGNALAKAGKLPEAIEAYEQALQQSPKMEDATHNKKLVEDLLKKQQEQEQQNQQEQQQNQEQSDNSEKQESNQQQEQNQQGEQQDQQGEPPDQQQNQQPQESSDQNQQNNDQQSSEQENANEEKVQTEQKADPQSSEQEQQRPEAGVKPSEAELSDEEQQAVEQWLRRIPDDPGGLLRRKFQAEAQRRRQEQRWNVQSPPSDKEQRW